MNKSHDSVILEIPMWKSKVGHSGQTCFVLAPYRKMKHEKMRLPCKTKKTIASLPSVSKTYLFFEQVPTCQCSGGEKGVVIRRLLKQKTWLRLVGCNRKGGSGVWRSEILDWECQGPDQEEVNFNTQQRRALRAVKRKREEVEAKLQVQSKVQFC